MVKLLTRDIPMGKLPTRRCRQCSLPLASVALMLQEQQSISTAHLMYVESGTMLTRRHFLKTVAATAAGSALASPLKLSRESATVETRPFKGWLCSGDC